MQRYDTISKSASCAIYRLWKAICRSPTIYNFTGDSNNVADPQYISAVSCYVFMKVSVETILCGHKMLTEGVFVTQLSSNVEISVWWIVWVATSCRERCVELYEYFIKLSWVCGRKQGILSLSFPQNSSNNWNSCADVQTFCSAVAMQLYRTSNGRLFPYFDQITLNLTNIVVSFPSGLGAGEMPCVLFRTTDECHQ